VPSRDIPVPQWATYWTTSATRLTSNLCLDFPCGLFPSLFVSKILNEYLHTPCVLRVLNFMFRLFPYFHICCTTKINNLMVKFLPFPTYLLPLTYCQHLLRKLFVYNLSLWCKKNLHMINNIYLLTYLLTYFTY